MRIAKILGWAALALLIVVTVAIVILLSLDLSTYRGALQSELSARVGRPVKLGGDMSWKVSLWPTIVVEDVAVANPSWASRPDFGRAERLQVRLALPPLFWGHVEILQLGLQGADILFERSPEGEKNWIFGRDKPHALMLPEIDSLTCEQCVLAYRGPSGEEQRLHVSAASAVLDRGEPIQLLATATYRGTAFSVSMLGGTPEALIRTDTEWPITLKIHVSDASFEIDGTVRHPLEGKDFDLRIMTGGEQLANLAKVLDITLPALGAYRLSGRVRDVDGEYNVTDMEARLGSPGAAGHLVVTGATASFGYDRPMALRATGQYDELSFSTALTGGTIAELISASGVWPVELTTRFGETVLNIEGSLSQPLRVQAYDLKIKIAGPGVAELEKLARMSFPSLGAYSLGGRLRVRDGDYAISALEGFIDSADAATRLAIAEGQASAAAGTPVSFRIKGTYRDAPFTLAFEGGRWADLFAPTQPWPVKLTANSLGSTAEISGTLARPLEAKGMDLRVKASGPRMFPLRRLIGTPVPSLGSYALSGRVADSEAGYRATDVKVRISAGELSGGFAFEFREERPYLSMQITSEALDLNKLIQAEGDAAMPVTAVPWDAPIAIPLLRTLDADVDLHIERMRRGPVGMGDYALTTRLRGGRLAVRPLRVQLPDTRIEGELDLDVRTDTAVVSAALSASAVDLGNIWKALTKTDSLSGIADDVSLKIAGRGRTIRALLPQASLSVTAGSGHIEYRRAHKEAHRIELSGLDGRVDDGGSIQLSVQGAFRDTPYRATFTGMRLAHLLAGDTHGPVSFSAQAAGASLVGEGTFTWPLGSPGWDLSLTLQGERIDALNTLLQVQLPALGPYTLSAKLDRTKSAYRLSGLEVRIDDNHATGRLEFATTGSHKRIVAKLSADELDLDDWIEWLKPTRAEKALTPDKEFVFANLDIPIGWLQRTDLQLEVEVSRIEAVGSDFGNVRLNVQAEQGRLLMGPLSATIAGGEISGILELDASADVPSSQFELTVRHLDYGRWLKALHVTDKVEGIVDIKITLRGSGNTLRAMLAEADGAALLASGPAQIAESDLGLWGAGFTSGLMSITTSALGMKRSTEFNCMVWPFNVSDGVAGSDAILMDTPKITIAGSGTVDLGTEKLDILLEPARKKPSLFSFQNPVRISGTLAAPKHTVLGKAKTFGKLGLVILQPYFLLFTAELGRGEKNPCVAALTGEPPPTKRRKKEAIERDLGLVGQLLTEMQKPVDGTLDVPASRPEP